MGALWLLTPFSSKSWALQVAMSPVSCFTHFCSLPGLQGTAVVTRVRTYQGAEAGLASPSAWSSLSGGIDDTQAQPL